MSTANRTRDNPKNKVNFVCIIAKRRNYHSAEKLISRLTTTLRSVDWRLFNLTFFVPLWFVSIFRFYFCFSFGFVSVREIRLWISYRYTHTHTANKFDSCTMKIDRKYLSVIWGRLKKIHNTCSFKHNIVQNAKARRSWRRRRYILTVIVLFHCSLFLGYIWLRL